uniref:Uncharacterized protein n=1 Tax=Candidatus Methanogaster sp. ANME-2c ERB4 TaxID=2759911 RepID=A0A7G9Y608_9EURY|nr:hypothetical protein PNPIFLLP_00003 [Methanosarcinales archaeon ANME-2c ERB4]
MIARICRCHIHHIRALACKREMRCSDVHVLIVDASRNTDRLTCIRIVHCCLYRRRSVCIKHAAVTPPAGCVDTDVAAGAAECCYHPGTETGVVVIVCHIRPLTATLVPDKTHIGMYSRTDPPCNFVFNRYRVSVSGRSHVDANREFLTCIHRDRGV